MPSTENCSLIQADELRSLLGGVSDMWLWRRMRDGSLPKPLVISKRRFWRRDEIANFIDERTAERDSANSEAA